MINLEKRAKSYKIVLPENELCDLYAKKGLTTIQIAKIYGCSVSTINTRLKNYGVNVNLHLHYKHIPKSLMEELYTNKKLSAMKIAKKFNCGKTAIQNKLKKYGVKPRNHSEAGKVRTDFKDKLEIPSNELRELYYGENLSMQQIAESYGTYSSCICEKFKKYKINPRTRDEGISLSIPRRSRTIAKSVIKYVKKPFSENLLEKAYLFGFAAGDLNVTKKKYGSTICVRTSTTKDVQVDLARNLLEKYSHVGLSKTKSGQYGLYCNLDESFSFLLAYKNDKIPDWALKDQTTFLSFLAGYTDAEGSFGVYNNNPQFTIASSDKNILFGISETLERYGVSTEGPKLITTKGHVDKRGVKWNKDIWQVRIRRLNELCRFISLIKPHIKHKKRYSDMIAVEENLYNSHSNFKTGLTEVISNV